MTRLTFPQRHAMHELWARRGRWLTALEFQEIGGPATRYALVRDGLVEARPGIQPSYRLSDAGLRWLRLNGYENTKAPE